MSRDQHERLRMDRIPDHVNHLILYHPISGQVIYDSKDKQFVDNPMSSADYFDLLASCCTCKKRHFAKIMPKKQTTDGDAFEVYSYGVCPVNQMASLLGRHLYTTVTPAIAMLDEFTAFANPLVKDLGNQVYDWTKSTNYDWNMHLAHYPEAVRG